jgi:hypothetical protein
MNSHFSDKELSAFFDGESRNRVEIEKHLSQCPECQAAMKSLTTISQSLQSWDEPEIHPAFATRILGQIGSQPAPSKYRFQWRFRIAALAAVVLGVFTYYTAPQKSNPSEAPNAVKVALNPTELADELVAQFGLAMADGESMKPFEAGFGVVSAKDVKPSVLSKDDSRPGFSIGWSSEAEAADTVRANGSLVETHWLTETDSATALSRLDGPAMTSLGEILKSRTDAVNQDI